MPSWYSLRGVPGHSDAYQGSTSRSMMSCLLSHGTSRTALSSAVKPTGTGLSGVKLSGCAGYICSGSLEPLAALGALCDLSITAPSGGGELPKNASSGKLRNSALSRIRSKALMAAPLSMLGFRLIQPYLSQPNLL
eukprot:CAMPEP_0178421758 /NCGR_PEP_ID=MMETSP0689_2-20121128/26815_1 /TAXON_ID=160604 /ORGANISM="Amphidinium massartii, Strain CS-259" /LENGTH=135 /DNA_ID=CAMNT_0020043285 /DNA_START=493 /DNA_END=900 /DNA_ORIENTATION=+